MAVALVANPSASPILMASGKQICRSDLSVASQITNPDEDIAVSTAAVRILVKSSTSDEMRNPTTMTPKVK
jgi:hypothetical protein